MKNIKKKLIYSFIALLFSSILGKLLSVFAKILIARSISNEAMSVYSLVLPTFTLLITISQLGISQTVAKLISKQKYNRFKIMQVAFFLSLLIDIIVGVIYILLVPIIANNLLKNNLTMLTLYGLVFILPVVSISSLLKGYFIGIDEVEKSSTCQISEELSRIIFIFVIFSIYKNQRVEIVSFLVFVSAIIGEIASIVHMLISLRKKAKFIPYYKTDNENNKMIRNNILSISLMSTSTRIIGALVYFVEPIIYTNIMLSLSIDKEKIFLEYGIINGYVFPTILLPSFFSSLMASFLLPKLSYDIEKNNYNLAKKKFLITTLISFLVGFICVLIIQLYPSLFLNLLYGKANGANYIKKYSILLSIAFIQPIIHCTVICFNKEKYLVIESLICNIIRIILFVVLIKKYQADGLILAIAISLYVSIVFQLLTIFQSFISMKNKCKLIINKKS